MELSLISASEFDLLDCDGEIDLRDLDWLASVAVGPVSQRSGAISEARGLFLHLFCSRSGVRRFRVYSLFPGMLR